MRTACLFLIACGLSFAGNVALGQPFKTIDEGFVRLRINHGKAIRELSKAEIPAADLAALDTAIDGEIKALSTSPAWGPQHPKWTEVKAAFRAETQRMITAARKTAANSIWRSEIDDAVPDVAKRYQKELSAQEQADLINFYTSTLGSKFLEISFRLDQIFSEAIAEVTRDKAAAAKRATPLSTDQQERLAGLIAIVDSWRLTGALAERKVIDLEQASDVLQKWKIVLAIRGSDMETAINELTDQGVSSIAEFQKTPLGKKDILVLTDALEPLVKKAQGAMEEAMKGVDELHRKWQNSPELR